MLDAIQDSVVCERDNFGDGSVCGDDLTLAACAAVLLYESRPDLRSQILTRARQKLEIIRLTMPSISSLLGELGDS